MKNIEDDQFCIERVSSFRCFFWGVTNLKQTPVDKQKKEDQVDLLSQIKAGKKLKNVNVSDLPSFSTIR